MKYFSQSDFPVFARPSFSNVTNKYVNKHERPLDDTYSKFKLDMHWSTSEYSVEQKTTEIP